jgi:hypothetical protein
MNEIFEKASENLQGTCMETPEGVLAFFLERDPAQEEIDNFVKFLEKQDVAECEYCGWWTFEGEGCICNDCANDIANDLDESLEEE